MKLIKATIEVLSKSRDVILFVDELRFFNIPVSILSISFDERSLGVIS
jgi:hypothetical protein